MTLSVEPNANGVRIVAVTEDGRRAVRNVRHIEALAPTALGLLMTISEVSADDSSFSTPAAVTRARARGDASTAVGAVRPAVVHSNVGLWAGLSGGLRITAPLLLSVLDVEARADILFDRWLMLLTLQSALMSCLGQQGLDCDVYNDVSFGAGVGRRFPLGGPDIDIAIEPSLVVMRIEYDLTPEAEAQAVEGTDVVMRFDVSVRLAVPLVRRWVLTLTLDGGVVPTLLARPTRLDLPPGTAIGAEPPPAFPAWSGGLRLGASGALL
jgi:hypothetical protein